MQKPVLATLVGGLSKPWALFQETLVQETLRTLLHSVRALHRPSSPHLLVRWVVVSRLKAGAWSCTRLDQHSLPERVICLVYMISNNMNSVPKKTSV